jgi:hypothetical protein
MSTYLATYGQAVMRARLLIGYGAIRTSLQTWAPESRGPCMKNTIHWAGQQHRKPQDRRQSDPAAAIAVAAK